MNDQMRDVLAQVTASSLSAHCNDRKFKKSCLLPYTYKLVSTGLNHNMKELFLAYKNYKDGNKA
jgi:hypothetical protein